MRVFEIFPSIQGETSRAGLPMWFVRLAGCNLKCTYCDTVAARDPAAGSEMTVEQVVETIGAARLPQVAITGGEPLLQIEEVNALIAALAGRRHEVLVETSGAYPVEALDRRAVRIVDVKTPGSGMAERTHWPNLDEVRMGDEVKFVLTSRADYEWSREIISRHDLVRRTQVLLSPATPGLQPRELAHWMLADALPVRLSLQIHKYIGVR